MNDPKNSLAIIIVALFLFAAAIFSACWFGYELHLKSKDMELNMRPTNYSLPRTLPQTQYQ